MSHTPVETLLQATGKLLNFIKNDVLGLYSTRSLVDATKLTRVEPLTIVSKDCLNLEYLPDITSALLNIFAGYYLQAVSIYTRVNAAEVIKVLDRLNPDRDESGWLMASTESFKNISLEGYKHSLPMGRVISLEQPKESIASVQELSNLSVGKLINIEIFTGAEKDGKEIKAVVPVNFRLSVSVIPNTTINQLLTVHSDDTTFIERWHAWRSGRINLIGDLIFCQDLIDEYKRATIGDETNTLQEIVRRVNNSKKFGLLTNNPSLVSASNLFIISEEVAREVESKLGGKLSNATTRKKAFDNTYAMIIAVVDREWERVTFYCRGINAGADVSVRELKSMTKAKGGIDVMDVLKALQNNTSPF